MVVFGVIASSVSGWGIGVWRLWICRLQAISRWPLCREIARVPKILIVLNTAWNLVNFRAGLIRALVAAGYEVVAVAPPDEYAMREAIDRLLQLTQTPGIKARCREVALRYFSLDKVVRAYDRFYRELGDTRA